MLGWIRSGRVRAARHARLWLAVLAAVGAVVAVGTASAAQSSAPAGCHVTPCLLIGPAGGNAYVFTAWESDKSPKFSSMDLTVWTKGLPTGVRSSGRSCTAPVLGHDSATVTYYNITCTISPAHRTFELCFNDRAGLEKLPTGDSNTAEFPQDGEQQAYAVQEVRAVARCSVKR